MFSLQSVAKHFGGQAILDGVDWQPSPRGVVGLVGPNGAGKTTLLRILCGVEEYDGGTVAIPRGCTIGYLPQELAESDAAGSALDVILQGRGDILEIEDQIEDAQRRVEAGEEPAMLEHAELLERFEQEGGWTFRSRARQIAAGLGFEDAVLDRPIHTFSGGWQMRASLGRLLLSKPDVLLLDEPTNHLDTATLEWLEEFLARYEGLVIVVSHDRWFLNRVTTHIAELQAGRLSAYVGNWDAYREQKALLVEQRAAQQSRQDREIARVRDFIERFRYKATKSKQVQSRVKALEKLESIDIPVEDVREIQFRFPQPPRGPQIVAEMRGVAKRYDAVEVWASLDFQITRGDKIALMGPNGAGKTTLLKVLANEISHDGGDVRLGPNVEVSYFAQHAVEQLNPDASVVDEMLAAADHDMAPRVRSILGAFGFSGEDHQKRIKVLSGGEKNRLALAKMMLAPAGLLLLDEPTNHLDVESRQVLEFALNDYDGAYVVVSHDRYFVNEVARRVVHLEDGAATEYLGDYEYYRRKRDELAATTPIDSGVGVVQSPPNPNSKKEARRAAAELRTAKREATGSLRRRLEQLEAVIAQLEEEVDEAQLKLQDPHLYDDEAKAQHWNERYRDKTLALESAMEEWGDVGTEIETIEQQLEAEGG